MPILIILTIATAATVLHATFTWRSAGVAAEDALKLQSLGIAASIEASLRRSDLGASSIFSDIIAEGGWEGIAYLSLHTNNGTVILHSNKNLIGRRAQDDQLLAVAATRKPAQHYIRLATDERVFVMDMPLHIHSGEYILRLALHTYPAESVIRQARLSIGAAAGVVIVLWVIGFFLLRIQRREDELRATMAERERLAVLGEMASVLAHEIRNPLGSIKGFAQYLREQQNSAHDRSIAAERMDSSLDVIVSEAERLETLTDDLLVYARTDEVRTVEFELCPLLEEAIAPYSQRGEISISATCTSEGLVRTDRNKLRQILINLLENALVAVESGGSVEVIARASRGTIELDIKDTGPGMPADVASRAFEPFFTTKTRGTGLGLAIVKRLVDLLHGSITLKTAPGEGVQFSIVLPPMTKDGT